MPATPPRTTLPISRNCSFSLLLTLCHLFPCCPRTGFLSILASIHPFYSLPLSFSLPLALILASSSPSPPSLPPSLPLLLPLSFLPLSPSLSPRSVLDGQAQAEPKGDYVVSCRWQTEGVPTATAWARCGRQGGLGGLPCARRPRTTTLASPQPPPKQRWEGQQATTRTTRRTWTHDRRRWLGTGIRRIARLGAAQRLDLSPDCLRHVARVAPFRGSAWSGLSGVYFCARICCHPSFNKSYI